RDPDPVRQAAGVLVGMGKARNAVEILREAGRKHTAGPLFLRAVQIALKKIGDSRFALATAVEGLEHAPGSGQLLLAFEQIALELHDVELATRTYGTLLERTM